MKVLLAHTPEMRRNYYGDRSLNGLRAIAEVILHEGDQAEVTVVVVPANDVKLENAREGGWRRFAGAVNSKDTRAADNDRIDATLADEYRGEPKAGA